MAGLAGRGVSVSRETRCSWQEQLHAEGSHKHRCRVSVLPPLFLCDQERCHFVTETLSLPKSFCRFHEGFIIVGFKISFYSCICNDPFMILCY